MDLAFLITFWHSLIKKILISQTEPDFDMDIRDEVQEECSGFGPVKHIYVDKYVNFFLLPFIFMFPKSSSKVVGFNTVYFVEGKKIKTTSKTDVSVAIQGKSRNALSGSFRYMMLSYFCLHWNLYSLYCTSPPYMVHSQVNNVHYASWLLCVVSVPLSTTVTGKMVLFLLTFRPVEL